MIYLDNSATTYHKPDGVKQAVLQAIGGMGNGGRGGNGPSLAASRRIYETRQKTAEFFGAESADRVAFTANATQALNMAIEGLAVPGTHMITTQAEHNSVLRPLYRKEKQGVEVTFLEVDSKGNFSLKELENSIKENTAAVVCTHVSNVTGNLTPIEKIGEICRKYRISFVLDASQSAGYIPISMEKAQVDILCFTGHKGLMGPQGIGGLCLSPEISLPSCFVGGSGIRSAEKEHPKEMPEALEAGTLNGHGIAGLGAAFDFFKETGAAAVGDHAKHLAESFYKKVSEIEGVEIYGDFSDRNRAPLVSLNIRGYDSKEAEDILFQEYNIAVRGGLHCAPLIHEAMRTNGAVRFSFSWFNTMEEVQKAVRAVEEMAEQTGGKSL